MASSTPEQPSPVPSLALESSTALTTPGTLVQTDGTLTVKLFADTDLTVSNAEYVLSGTAPAGTVISINDDVLQAGPNQSFSTTLSLEEGPNYLEVVASDETGQEVSFLLTVTYLPDS
jgi:hypothetical protein